MSERVLYFDCFSGLAGDMTLGALIDLGVDAAALEAALRTLPLGADWQLDVREGRKMGLRGVDVHVVVGGRVEGAPIDGHEHGHDHDHGHEHGHGHDHDHGSSRARTARSPVQRTGGGFATGARSREQPGRSPAAGRTTHEHGHEHGHGHGYGYLEIVGIIEGGKLPAVVRERALAAFRAIAEAEARVHGVDVEEVHFHEVGAVDSIVDVVGSAWGIWQLGIDRVESAPPPMGRGFFKCAHGRMPSPAPATLEILKGVPIAPAGLDRELVTPTGAAFVRAWADRVGGFPAMVVEGVGWGVGDADFPDRPNLLRLVLGRTDPGEAECTVVEANVDDMSPELAGYLLERLFEAGARDAWFVPVHMKKNRPGLVIGALCDAGSRAAVEEMLLAESSAIGLRRFPVTRLKLDRAHVTVDTPFGPVPVKVARRGGAVVNAAPEYEACARLARDHGVPLKTVYQHAVAGWMARGDPEARP